MIALYLLAAHMVGDFVLQTRWQAADKIANRSLRRHHVASYCLPFLAVVAHEATAWWKAIAFMVLLAVLHYLTDSHRFLSTLGDVVGWYDSGMSAESLRPNPWPPIAILIDQTLHVCQLAILGGVFLT